MITVGQETITAKRDLVEIFPPEFTNRKLINQYIQYILNNYFEKSKEKLVSSYVGNVVESVDGTETYIKEPTVERQLNQIIPVLKAGDDKITFSNYMADLHNEGCTVYDQNKLLSSKFWSWCPPVNVDAFINFVNYIWIGYPYEENDIKVFNAEINVKDEIIGKKTYTYREYNDIGEEVYSYTLKNGDIVIFPNDTGKTYNATPYKVVIAGQEEGNANTGYISLKSLSVPLIIIAKETNISSDILGAKNYTFEDEERGYKFDLLNGMRIRFLNDINQENNNVSFIVQGVGESIEFVDDSYNPYSGTTDHSTVTSPIFERDYFVMERGSSDGNDWSRMNRWVQRQAIEAMNIGSMEASASDGALPHARKPLLIFNKDIELYNYGTFNRGNVKYALNLSSSDINGTVASNWYDEKIYLYDGDRIMLFGNVGSSSYQLYKVRIVDEIVYLDILVEDAQTSDGSTAQGDTIKVTDGSNAGKVYYYNGYEWIIGQSKTKVNQKPLFNLYDIDEVLLDNTVNYPNSTFKGCTLFQYQQSDSVINDEDVGMPIVVDEDDPTNFFFESTLVTDTFKYTPPNDYEKEITGYRLYKNIKNNSYLNDWHYSDVSSDQYLKTIIEVYDDGEKYPFAYIDKESYDEYVRGETDTYKTYLPKNKDNLENFINEMESLEKIKKVFRVYILDLKYTPIVSNDRKTLIITNNDIEIDSSDIIKVEDYKSKYYVKNVDIGDTLVIKLLPSDVNDRLDEDYVYDYPLSLTVNQFNKDIDIIGYNNCFNQLTDIIKNQLELKGSPIGSNNYSSIVPNVSVGTKIIQSCSSVIRSMVLNNNYDTSIRGSINYAQNSYNKFKKKFINLVEQENLSGNIIDDSEIYASYEANPADMDEEIKSIINRINIGKDGLVPFYNNGVMTIMENAYIPATPAYLGISNCYEPRIEDWEGYTLDVKPSVVVGHDGSLTRASHSVKDLFLLRLEQLIYQSIENKFKDTRCGLNIYPYLPGKFRTNTYTRQEFLNAYSPLFEKWCIDNNVSYAENNKFEYDSFDVKPNCWKTWNYTGCLDVDGEKLYGSYRAVYTYYYDTYRPDTHPWEMLGFGDEPSWWESVYGPAPYTSENLVLWEDIENGIIRKGPWAGEYKELKRPGLVERFIPVDESGKLKNPIDIGIIENQPTAQLARKKWVIGDIGDVEFAYLQMSDSKYSLELVKYMLRPVEWVETTWNTLDREVIFKGTNYEQVIDSSTNSREDISKMIMHNELIDGEYVRKIGSQQWISDYLTSNTFTIGDVADYIRSSDVSLGYRCAGFYQKGTVEVVTDTYGVLPEENVHIDLLNSKRENIYTYSGMSIVKTKRGYLIDGFDMSDPYFRVRMPETTGKKSTINVNSKTFYYYHQYKNAVTKVPYKTEFDDMQDVYDVIIAYGRYLTENENWYFSTLSPNGTVLDFRTSAESFATWATSLKGNDTENALLLLNPGSIGIGNYNSGIVDDVDNKVAGFASVRDIYGNPVDKHNIDVYRQAFNTYFEPKNDLNISLIKFRTYDLEHLITFDNTTIYNDVLYNSVYSAQIERFKLYGVKVLNWYGTLYAPGYIVRNDGAIANYDKSVNDLQYIFDVDDVHCQGKYAEYSRGIVGYKETKTYKDLYKNDKSMFDFYKGAIRHKGTKNVLAKMNRSTNISSTGNNIELFEQWAFKEGQYGHIKDNSVDEFILDTSKMIQNPQIITFETATNYYYDQKLTYNYGDICIYNNYEYIAKRNNITGNFDAGAWKQVRYVGNYIIFNTDPNWIKKSNTAKVNCFKYTNNLLINPIGGFAKTDECSYIIATEDDLRSINDSMEVGEVVWIVKTKLGDWDVRKKTGISKFVSMRYFNIKDAVNQEAEEFVYHFKDDRIDYYSIKDDKNIDIKDPVYSDADIDYYECKWGDIGIPEYTGNVGSYVTGTDYKVKLYNTVFVTQSQQNELNNGTPFQNIYDKESEDKVSISYSNLLLNMVQFGVTLYKFKWLFTIKAETTADDVKIVINGNTYNKPNGNKVDLIVSEGDELNWSVSARACGVRSGTTKVEYVSTALYTMTKDQIANLSDEKKVEYKLIQNLNLTIPLSYRKGATVYQANAGKDVEPIVFQEGEYDVEFVGAGGGAGGGSTCHRKHHSKGGCAGAGGAYLHGTFFVTENDATGGANGYTYTIVTGKGGKGGAPAHHAGGVGANGGNSGISRNKVAIIYAQGGAGGANARNNGHYTSGGRPCGYGGKLQSKEELQGYNFSRSNDSRNGNNGGLGAHEGNPGASVYPTGNYGKGGMWVYRGTGKTGVDGKGKIVFKTSSKYDEYTTYDKSPILYLSMEFSETDSLDYSAYYQPYIIPPKADGTTQYFYSYELLHEDEKRPEGRILSDSSSFYRNRAKSVTAYLNPGVLKGDIWENASNRKYYVGDTTNIESGTYKGYWICETDCVATGNFTPTATVSNETVVYWREYSPTYYYKITYNDGPVEKDPQHPENDPTDPRYQNGKYELFEDEDCTIRAEKNNGDFIMNCSDLDFSRPHTIGMKYSLVDKFATYYQLTPRYLNEPTWSTINQVATYQISSGGIDYYVNSDIRTITADEKSLVYNDTICSNPVQSIKPVIYTDSDSDSDSDSGTLVYKNVDMKYVDILNTVTDHKEPSYEMKDKDIYLYTSKTKNELTDDTPVFDEFELLNQNGVYSDYIPVWEQINTLPNKYTNEIKYVKYNETESSKDAPVKLYVNTLEDSNDEPIELFYDEFGTKKFYFIPSKCDEDRKVIHTGLTLYFLNKFVANTHDDLPTSGMSENDICRVVSDTTRRVGASVTYKQNEYYQYTNNSWEPIGTYPEICNKSQYFTEYDDVYVERDDNVSTLYPEVSFTNSSIDNTDVISNNGTNNTIALYFNEQSVGRHLVTESMITDTGETENIKMMWYSNNSETNPEPDDPMYNLISEMISEHSRQTDLSARELYYLATSQYSGRIYYLDENEAISIYNTLEQKTIDYLKGYYRAHRFVEHTCKIYDMYRNINNNREYTKLCLYGEDFYAIKTVTEPVTSETVKTGIYYGRMETLTTYNKFNYEYSSEKIYYVGDLCLYNDIGYECIRDTAAKWEPDTMYEVDDTVIYDNKLYKCETRHTSGESFELSGMVDNEEKVLWVEMAVDVDFDTTQWIEYSRDKIVNVITYMDLNDLIYVTSDNYGNRVIDGVSALCDTSGCSKENGALTLDGKNGWMKMKYIDKEFIFDLTGCERKRLAVDTIKSCYLVDNSNDGTIVDVQVFDPIQNIIPNNILKEINYISSSDPVNDYTDIGKWSDNKLGFLWWDTSKVRYVDYYQGDYEYRRNNWGKQLPGSEIAIMEWTKSVTPPEDGVNYVERSTYNYKTSTVETYYYYWNKNPTTIPEVTFRTTSAYHIAELINDPTGQGVIWMSPIDSDISGKNDNTMIITNFSNVMTGQEAVLQLNTDSDKEIMDHTEWVMIKENTNDDIPDWLWEKMTDSLLGYKTIDGVNMPVPAENLVGRQRLGIAFRPRQTMFDNNYEARRNFIDAINGIFNTRTEEQMMIDLGSGLEKNVDEPVEGTYDDEAGTMLELMSWKDDTLFGQRILVRHDETHDNIWVIYLVNRGFTYSIVDYQKYNIQKYLYYADWYLNDSITYKTPVYIETISQSTAKDIADGDIEIPGAHRKIKEGELVKYQDDNGWIIYQNNGYSSEIVGKSKSIMQFDNSIYDFVNEDIDNTEEYIKLYKQNTEDGSLELVKTLTKYDYIKDETTDLIKILIDYVDVEADE